MVDLLDREHGGSWCRPKIADRVRNSERVQQELNYCAPLGIPRSIFVGERGLPGPGEEVWTEDDVEYALEWRRLKDSLCPGCGQPRDESYAEGNYDAYDTRPIVCHACAAHDRDMAAWRDQGNNTDGLSLVVVKREELM